MSFQVKGFGFVEVVMLLVVIAILASTAIPSFVTGRADDRQVAVDGVAGSLSSASAINYAVRSIHGSNGVAISNCVDVVNALEGSLDNAFRIESAPIATNTKGDCKVVNKAGESAIFVAHGVS